MRGVLFAAVLCLTACSQTDLGDAESRRPATLLIWAGQSNVQTHGVTGELPGFPRKDIPSWTVSLNNWVYSSADIEPLGPRTVDGAKRWGPWAEGSASVKDATGGPVLSVMVGKGATHLGSWLSTTGPGELYQELKAASESAKEAFGGDFRTHLIWIQGESDSQVEFADTYYRQQLELLVSEQRALHGADLRIHVIELHPGMARTPSGDAVRGAQVEFTEADPLAELVPVADLDPDANFQSDGVHYNAAGVSEVAARVAASIISTDTERTDTN